MFTIVSTQNTEFILVVLFINYYILYLYYNYEPTFAHPIYTVQYKAETVSVIDELSQSGHFV